MAVSMPEMRALSEREKRSSSGSDVDRMALRERAASATKVRLGGRSSAVPGGRQPPAPSGRRMNARTRRKDSLQDVAHLAQDVAAVSR